MNAHNNVTVLFLSLSSPSSSSSNWPINLLFMAALQRKVNHVLTLKNITNSNAVNNVFIHFMRRTKRNSVHTEHKLVTGHIDTYPDFPKLYTVILWTIGSTLANYIVCSIRTDERNKKKTTTKHFILKVQYFELKLNRMKDLYTATNVIAIEFLVQTIQLLCNFYPIYRKNSVHSIHSLIIAFNFIFRHLKPITFNRSNQMYLLSRPVMKFVEHLWKLERSNLCMNESRSALRRHSENLIWMDSTHKKKKKTDEAQENLDFPNV